MSELLNLKSRFLGKNHCLQVLDEYQHKQWKYPIELYGIGNMATTFAVEFCVSMSGGGCTLKTQLINTMTGFGKIMKIKSVLNFCSFQAHLVNVI